jgi:hypothetical protein
MQIFVKLNKTLTYNVCQTDIIENLRKKINYREGLPDDMYYLTHNGKVLENGRVLSDYLIEEASTIFINFRIRGGREHFSSNMKLHKLIFSNIYNDKLEDKENYSICKKVYKRVMDTVHIFQPSLTGEEQIQYAMDIYRSNPSYF